MNPRLYVVTLVVGLLCLGLTFAAPVAAADKNPCSEDIAKFCKNVKSGGGAIIDCLEKHESELSTACKDFETQMGGRRAEMREEVQEQKRLRQACQDDVAKFCKDVKPGTGGIAKCLSDHENELSTPCREEITAMKEEKKKAKQVFDCQGSNV